MSESQRLLEETDRQMRSIEVMLSASKSKGKGKVQSPGNGEIGDQAEGGSGINRDSGDLEVVGVLQEELQVLRSQLVDTEQQLRRHSARQAEVNDLQAEVHSLREELKLSEGRFATQIPMAFDRKGVAGHNDRGEMLLGRWQFWMGERVRRKCL